MPCQESKNEANSNNILEETRNLPGDENVENKQKTHTCSNKTLSKIKEKKCIPQIEQSGKTKKINREQKIPGKKYKKAKMLKWNKGTEPLSCV